VATKGLFGIEIVSRTEGRRKKEEGRRKRNSVKWDKTVKKSSKQRKALSHFKYLMMFKVHQYSSTY
jgi:hypothetical protein